MNSSGIAQIILIGLVSLFFINNISALDVPSTPDTSDTSVQDVSDTADTSVQDVSDTADTEVSDTSSTSTPNTSSTSTPNTSSTSTPNTSSTSTPNTSSTSTPNTSSTSTPNTSSTSTPNTSSTSTPNTSSIQQIEVPDTQNIGLPDTKITQPLNSATFNTWTNSFSAAIVSGNASTVFNNANQLPTIITAENPSEIKDITNSQSSVLLDVSFPSLTNGWIITSGIGLPSYTLPDSVSSIPVIPAIVTTVDSESGQFVVASLGKIIPGQEIIVSVADSLIPSFGGLKQISLQPSLSAIPTGQPPPSEWITAEVNNKIPGSLPSSGLYGTPILFVNLQYPFELSGIGYNWGDPATFAKPPTLTLVVNKIDDDSIQKDNAGCPVIDAFTLSSGAWTSNGLGQTSSQSTSPTTCEIKIQTQHFSKFAFSLKHISSIHSSGPGLFGLGKVISDPALSLLVISDKKSAIPPTIIQKPVTQPTRYETVQATEGFANVVCSRGYTHVFLAGEYTGGDIPYKVIFLTMELLDSAGNVLTTGSGSISDVGSHKTKVFNAIARYHADIDSCAIKITTAIPK